MSMMPVQTKSSLSDLAVRAASSILMAALAFGVTWWGGWPFTLFWFLASAAIAYEWLSITSLPRLWLLFSLIMGASALVLSLPSVMDTSHMLNLQIGVLASAALIGLLIVRSQRDRLWFIAGFAYTLVIALVPTLVRHHTLLGDQGGFAAVLWMFAVVWLTDIFAYFSGRLIGGAKLWPAISPKKTWAGFIGGVSIGAIGGVMVYITFMSEKTISVNDVMLVGIASLLAAMMGQGGDLAESAIKRHFDVKDASHLIPGHGGVMDRLDAFWAVCVIVGFAMAVIPFLKV
jgi:phosphatidate cytidylyltransferase